MSRMKNKTLAAWLAFLGGPLGLHRFYLHGIGDLVGWALPIPTALGVYGLQRVQALGVDDVLSWLLIPLLGFTIAGCALTAIVYGLMTPEKWNARFNPQAEPEHRAGSTSWLTVFGIAAALIDASGDVLVSAAPPGTTGWRIAVAPAGTVAADHVMLVNAAITTSGDAHQAVEIDGAGGTRRLDCDLVAVSGGWNPAVQLQSHTRARLGWDKDIAAFVPGTPVQAERSAGAALGIFGIAPLLFVTVMTGFEIFIAILQAYVFALLSTIYLSEALADHDHH